MVGRAGHKAFALAVGLCVGCPAHAQKVPRDQYLHYLPKEVPSRVEQTPESVRFALFGDVEDPGYVDARPENGIDDRQDAFLMALAVRFAPILVRNTSNVPLDFRKFIHLEPDAPFPLTIDTWDISRTPARILRTESIDFARLDGAAYSDEKQSEDRRLAALLERYDLKNPDNAWAKQATRRARGAPLDVLFFQFPGDDASSWRAEYTQPYGSRLRGKYEGFQKLYVHPFVTRATSASGSGYELVLQYWFFYPNNDSGNKHSGDWEHINVVVSPRSLVTRPLSERQLRDVLERAPAALAAGDPLVVRRAEYYFHHNVMILDHAWPNVYAPRAAWQAEVERLEGERVGARGLYREIRYRAYLDDAEQLPNTHCVAFIGGDDKGLELILGAPGPANRDSHGTYPFSGLFADVGPVGSSEEIDRHFDVRGMLRGKKWPEEATRFDDARRLELVPDAERVLPLMKTSARARRDWSWLLLPIRWGYPAVESPFAGIIPNADTGNASPVGPSFNGGWNRTGASAGYRAYEPHRLAAVFPISPLSQLRNTWGFFNAPALVFLNAPPFDLVFKLLPAPVRAVSADPVYYPKSSPPHRVVGFAGGVTTQFLDGDDWTALFLNDDQEEELIGRIMGTSEGGVVVENVNASSEPAVAPVVQVVFHLSDHWAAENLFRYSRTAMSLEAVLGGGSVVPIDGTLEMYEWAGSFRYDFLVGSLRPYAKVGYGLSWYRLQDVHVAGDELNDSTGPWLKKPSLVPFENILPNTLHYGAGLELIVLRGQHPLSPGLSLKLDATVFHHTLGLTVADRALAGIEGQGFVSRGALSILAELNL